MRAQCTDFPNPRSVRGINFLGVAASSTELASGFDDPSLNASMDLNRDLITDPQSVYISGTRVF